MARASRSSEENLLRKLVPWLSTQLGDDLSWQGRPEETDYASLCPAARQLARPLDAELVGSQLKVAVEHTTLDSFAGQRRFGALFNQLRKEVRSLKSLVPPGNNLKVGLLLASVADSLTRNDAQRAIPEVIGKLQTYLQRLPAHPRQDDIVRGHLLEEPAEWVFEGFTVRVSRYWLSRGNAIHLVSLVDDSKWDCGVQDCLRRALAAKLGNKGRSYEVYRRAGWFAALILEIVDWQLSSVGIVGEAFRQIANQFNLRCVDGIALAQQLGEDDDTPECCWVYLRGEIRTAEQQYREMCECLGIEPQL